MSYDDRSLVRPVQQRIIFKFNGLHNTSVSIGVNIFFTIPTHVFSTHVILGLPFLVRDDFVTLLTFIKFLAHGLAVSVRSTVVGITVCSCEHSVAGTAFSPVYFNTSRRNPCMSIMSTKEKEVDFICETIF